MPHPALWKPLCTYVEVTYSTLCVPAPVLPSLVLPTFFVVVFVASFSKVPMMSVAKQKHSSPPDLMNSSCFLHSPHAISFVSSGCPGPLGSPEPVASELRKLTAAAREKPKTRQR